MQPFPFKLIDLTHTISRDMPTWDGGCGFEHPIDKDYDPKSQYQFRTHKINAVAGIGTHLDAPAHCIPGGRTIGDYDVNELLSPCVVVDVRPQVHESYVISREDIAAFEAKHGVIQKNSVVLFWTGWDRFWSDAKKYRNNLEFPSVSGEVASFLVKERDIAGLGIDTLSPDCPRNGYPVHQTLLSQNRYIIENVANLEKLPATDSFVLALPMKIKEGTEAPIRLVGFITSAQQ